MKLTTKLLISLGLFFILGMQAFANSITIQNYDCGSKFIINGDFFSSTSWSCFDKTIGVTVPAGKISPTIPIDWTTTCMPLGTHVYVCPVSNAIFGCHTILLPSLSGKPYELKFNKVGGECVVKY